MSDGIYTHYDELLSERGRIEEEIVESGRFTQQEIDEIGLLEVVRLIMKSISKSNQTWLKMNPYTPEQEE